MSIKLRGTNVLTHQINWNAGTIFISIKSIQWLRMKIVPLFHFLLKVLELNNIKVPQKYYDSLVIFDFSTPGSINPESLRAESYEILN